MPIWRYLYLGVLMKTIKFSATESGGMPNLFKHIPISRKALIFSMLAAILPVNSALCTDGGSANVMSFDYFSQEDGLPNNQVQCIYQDRRGWIWLGTSQGHQQV